MNKFFNTLLNGTDRSDLQNALIKWVLGCDGENGATKNVVGCIPWSDEMQSVVPWDKYSEKFDAAIGGREFWNNEIVGIITSNITKNRFMDFINQKLDDIVCVYQEAIVEANHKISKCCGVVEIMTGVDNGLAKYKIIDRFYGDTKFDVISGIWVKYNLKVVSDWSFGNFCDAMYKGSVCLGNKPIGMGIFKGCMYAHLGDKVTNS